MAVNQTQLARLNQMEKSLAEAKTLEEFKATADMSQTFAHWAKKIGASRTICNQVTDYFISNKIGMGLVLGPAVHGRGRRAREETVKRDKQFRQSPSESMPRRRVQGSRKNQATLRVVDSKPQHRPLDIPRRADAR